MKLKLLTFIAVFFTCCGGIQHIGNKHNSNIQDACYKLEKLCSDPIPMNSCMLILKNSSEETDNSNLSKYTADCILDASSRREIETCPGVSAICSKN